VNAVAVDNVSVASAEHVLRIIRHREPLPSQFSIHTQSIMEPPEVLLLDFACFRRYRSIAMLNVSSSDWTQCLAVLGTDEAFHTLRAVRKKGNQPAQSEAGLRKPSTPTQDDVFVLVPRNAEKR
jgi:hypothetical protein